MSLEMSDMVWCEPKSAQFMATATWDKCFRTAPKTRGSLLYCINSALLRFIHRVDMLAAEYGEYLDQVEDK